MLATAKKQTEDEGGKIVRRTHRCMRNVLQGRQDQLTSIPLKPLEHQPSAWSASQTVKKAVITVWWLIPAYTIWGAIIYALSVYAHTWTSKLAHISAIGTGFKNPSQSSWAFLPNPDTQSFAVAYLTAVGDNSASLPGTAWPSILLTLMVLQSGLTLVLHNCEAVINTTQDEHVWRKAAGVQGVVTSEPGFWKVLYHYDLRFTAFLCDLGHRQVHMFNMNCDLGRT